MLEEARKATRRNAMAVVANRRGGERREYAHRNVTMVRTVIHEMRSPLTVIRAYSSAVLAQKVRLSIRETKEVMARIESSARLLEVILEDLETMTEIGTVRLRPAVIDMASFVSEIATDLQALIPGRELELNVQPMRVQTDPARLRQVLNNLVQNAHKYSKPSGRIAVHVAPGGDAGRIAVQDEGPGVSSEEIAHIFDPYYRAEGHENRAGRGLGLAISRRLIEAQGGTLEAGQTPEGRFQLMISLPLAG
jgi:two-component system, OmpR family, sensor histidine kinase BaeS